MRKFFSITGATFEEILNEPLALLLTVSALALAVLAPFLHFHEFGEVTRTARDAGISALTMFGLLYVVFLSIRSLRREFENGIMNLTLAHAVSRSMYVVAKAAGVFLAYLVFALTLFAETLITVKGVELGNLMRGGNESMPTLSGVSLALSIAPIFLPIIFAGLANRFFGRRFTLSAALTMPVIAFLGTFYHFDFPLIARMLPVAVMPTFLAAMMTAASFAAAAVFKANLAAGSVFALAVAALPVIGNHCLVDALSQGGTLSWGYVAMAALAASPIIAAFLLAASWILERRDA